jgi:hypothetical protein
MMPSFTPIRQWLASYAATASSRLCSSNWMTRANIMDEKPFFTFNLEAYRQGDLKHLAAFQRADFNLDRIVAQAGTLKLQTQVSAELRKEFAEPSEDFVRLIASRLHEGRLIEGVREKFQGAIVQAIGNLIRDGINERLQSAMAMSHADEPELADAAEPDSGGVETTQVEQDGFNIVRAICSKLVDPQRVVLRDQSPIAQPCWTITTGARLRGCTSIARQRAISACSQARTRSGRQ